MDRPLAPPRRMLVPTADAEPWWRWLVDFPANVQMGVLPGAMVATVAKIVQIDPRVRESKPTPATA